MPYSSIVWYISGGSLVIVPLMSVYAKRRRSQSLKAPFESPSVWIAFVLALLGVLMILYRIYGVQVTANPL